MSSKYVPQTFPDTVLCDRCGYNYISTLPAIEPPVFSNSLSSVDKTVMHSIVERALARVTYVARIRIPEVIPFVGRVCCLFSPLFPCVFSANNVVFPFPQKGALAIPNSKWCWEMVDEELLCEYGTIIQSHLFIIFYYKTMWIL